MKIKLFEHTFIFKTKKKTCPQCNGKGFIDTDIGKDGCDLCFNTGIFINAFKNSIDGMNYGNLFFFKKYLTAQDFEIAEKINCSNMKKNKEQGHLTKLD